MDSSLAVAEAYEAFAADLRRFVMARTRDVAASDDIVQEAFTRLANESRAGRHPRNPRAWLYRVALNLIIAGSRHAEVTHRVEHRLASRDLAVSPEVLFLASEDNVALRAALEGLRPQGRTSLMLAAQGYSGREIAERIGLSEGATRTMMCRARVLLRRELNPELTLVG